MLFGVVVAVPQAVVVALLPAIRVGLNTFCRRRGNSQQHKNIDVNVKIIIIRQPVRMPHQIIVGMPRNVVGVPASTGGHIRAVSVTDAWYRPIDD